MRSKPFSNHLRALTVTIVCSGSFIISGFSSALAKAAAGAQMTKQEKRFNSEAQKVVKELLAYSLKGAKSHPAASPKVIQNLNQIYQSAGQVQFRFFGGQMSGAGHLSCMSNMSSQWFTKNDNPLGKFPMVVWRTYTEPTSLNAESWQLMVHETISSLGVVDDEYQVSGPIMELFATGFNGRQAPSDDVKSLSQIERRSSTPKFRLGAEELCYDQNGQLKKDSGGSTSGIGGGGDPTAMMFKRGLKAELPKWWKKNVGSPSGTDYQNFEKLITTLGVEPLEEHPRLITNFPIQMEFVKSKRTKRLAARFKLNETRDYWKTAGAMIFAHLRKYGASTRHTVYGAELAEQRGLIKKDTWWKYPHDYKKPFRR